MKFVSMLKSIWNFQWKVGSIGANVIGLGEVAEPEAKLKK